MPKLAVIGFPVSHSRSPAMQSAALEEMGLAPEWSYEAVEAAPGDLEATVRQMAAGEFAGANVTVPHKQAALALAGGASEAARAIGAANTLSFPGGRIEADNTDAGGLLASLPDDRPAGRVLVLGAGGAARAAIWALSGDDDAVEAGDRRRVDVWNRTAARAAAVASELGGNPVEAPDQGEYGLIVNTTAVGLQGEDPFDHLPLAAEGFVSGQTVVDMVYGERPSALLAAAEAAGATVVDGIEVLVQQGALSLEIWTGRKPDLDAMRRAARR